MNEIICFAHRGAGGHEPENTLLSIRKALSLGAHWIEIDVHAAEGELVVIHDETLERTTDGRGHVAEQSLEYLRSLDAGKGERIPLLREVFDLAGRRAGINIELKGRGTAAPAVYLIDEYVNRHGWTHDRILVSSFKPRELKKVKSLQPGIRTGLIVEGLPLHCTEIAEELGAYSIHPGLKFINRRFVEDAHLRGLKVFVFTVNSAEEIERMRLLGVDGVFTDYPELVASGPN
jgi:glycerophosphoryl diester phosphodiesterase